MNVICIVQARLGSERLPRKVLADIQGRTMLERVVDRATQIRGVDDVVVAIPSRDRVDIEPIIKNGLMAWDGPETDVLGRYHAVAKRMDADIIIRITADCPLLDPDISEQVLRAYLYIGSPLAFAHNSGANTDGFDTEVFSAELLRLAELEADDADEREHVTPWMRKHGHVKWVSVIGDAPKLSVDTERELDLVKAIYAKLPEGATSRESTLKAYHKIPSEER